MAVLHLFFKFAENQRRKCDDEVLQGGADQQVAQRNQGAEQAVARLGFKERGVHPGANGKVFRKEHDHQTVEDRQAELDQPDPSDKPQGIDRCVGSAGGQPYQKPDQRDSQSNVESILPNQGGVDIEEQHGKVLQIVNLPGRDGIDIHPRRLIQFDPKLTAEKSKGSLLPADYQGGDQKK